MTAPAPINPALDKNLTADEQWAKMLRDRDALAQVDPEAAAHSLALQGLNGF